MTARPKDYAASLLQVSGPAKSNMARAPKDYYQSFADSLLAGPAESNMARASESHSSSVGHQGGMSEPAGRKQGGLGEKQQGEKQQNTNKKCSAQDISELMSASAGHQRGISEKCLHRIRSLEEGSVSRRNPSDFVIDVDTGTSSSLDFEGRTIISRSTDYLNVFGSQSELDYYRFVLSANLSEFHSNQLLNIMTKVRCL